MIEPVAATDRRRRLSEALLTARARRRPLAPLTETDPDLTLGDAYAIARLGVDRDLADGATAVGHKIGLTSPAVQRQLGVDTPDYGVLLDSMRIADGSTVDLDAVGWIAPRIEVELAFELGAPLPAEGVTAEHVRAATRTVRAAFEIVDSRIADWRITLRDTIADRASSAAFVLGDVARPLDALETGAVSVSLERDGETVEQGRSDAVLGDPCAAVAWLANAVGALGEPLAAGETILSGAITPMVPVRRGEAYRALFDQELGEISLTVA